MDPARICTDSYLTQMRGEENQEMMVWMSYVQKSGVGEEGACALGEGSTVRGLGDDFAVGGEVTPNAVVARFGYQRPRV